MQCIFERLTGISNQINTLIRSIIFHIEEHHKNSGQNHSMMTICYYWMTCCDGRFEMGNALSGIGIGMWTCDGWWIRAKILMSGAMWQILRNAKRGCSFRSLAHHVKRRKVRFFCFVFFWYFFLTVVAHRRYAVCDTRVLFWIWWWKWYAVSSLTRALHLLSRYHWKICRYDDDIILSGICWFQSALLV